MILGLESRADDVAREAGGKGHNLWLLAHRGAPVPPFFVVGASAFERFARGNAIRLGEGAQEAVLAAPVPEAIASAVKDAFAALGAGQVAVRSSALGEDSSAQSFAGQLQTFLYVSTPEGVIDAVRRCWASAFAPRALAYMRQHGIEPAGARVAVVVQAMVDAEAAGVVFTVDPVSGDLGTAVISAVRGLGEGLVSGLLDSDDFHIDKASGRVIRREIARKELRLARAELGGVREEPVPEVEREAPAVNEEQLGALWASALEIERGYGAPQDIEWAIAGGRLFILQARPVTAAKRARGPVQIWDNSNIIESYSGVTTPLTFTFARNAYHRVYVQFCEVMGVPRREVERRDPVLRNMLGYVEGRIYYNLLNWYHLVGLFPGFRANKGFMEGMMGVRESLPPDAQALLQLPGKATLGEKLRQVGLGAKMAWRFVTLRKTVARFRTNFEESYARFGHTRFEGQPLEELLAAYDEMDAAFLRRWKAPIINDFFAMIFFGALRKLTRAWGLDEAGALQNDLLCGEGGVESTVPTETLIELAIAIRERPAWREAFASAEVAAVRRRVEEEPALAELRARIDDYLDRFGFRCMNELKLEEPDLHADPTFVYRTLQNYVERPPLTVPELRAREQAIRARAEQAVRAKLRGLRLRAYLWILGHARETVKNRENLRFARTKVFGLARRLFDAIGADLAARGKLASPRDVYFLQLDELRGLVDAALATQDLRALAAIRKAERERFLAAAPADRFVTRGAVYWGNDFSARVGGPAADGVLRGIACCPGRVQAPAKVIQSPRDDLRLGGDILVAERTDPGWTPLFPSASGILVERGSLLSHSAIVARELGIPCVVGIPGLTRTLHTGEVVEMDGGEGWARVVDRAEGEAA